MRRPRRSTLPVSRSALPATSRSPSITSPGDDGDLTQSIAAQATATVTEVAGTVQQAAQVVPPPPPIPVAVPAASSDPVEAFTKRPDCPAGADRRRAGGGRRGPRARRRAATGGQALLASWHFGRAATATAPQRSWSVRGIQALRSSVLVQDSARARRAEPPDERRPGTPLRRRGRAGDDALAASPVPAPALTPLCRTSSRCRPQVRRSRRDRASLHSRLVALACSFCSSPRISYRYPGRSEYERVSLSLTLRGDDCASFSMNPAAVLAQSQFIPGGMMRKLLPARARGGRLLPSDDRRGRPRTDSGLRAIGDDVAASCGGVKRDAGQSKQHQYLDSCSEPRQ